jgi:hypothetical protein
VPKLFSYVVVRDFGFAPNPFHELCTLATCKPGIRAKAEVGDYIIGTATVQRFPAGKLIFAMRVTEAMSFDKYWNDPRYLIKRPVLNGSAKFQYGDNIYHHSGTQWIQEDSHHSYDGGAQNPHNLARDTSADRVLVSDHFTYWGGDGLMLPKRFRASDETGVVNDGRGYRCQFPDRVVGAFVQWLEPRLGQCFRGRPFSW